MEGKRLKGLFVTHNYGLYGASQSLQLLLNNQNEFDVTLVIPRKKILSQEETKRISHQFGVEHTKIKQFFLPWTNCFEGRKTDFRSGLLIDLKNLLWKANKNRFYRFLSSGGYDFIHLNSIVLCEMITDGYPFVIHIRELLIDYFNKVLNHVHKAKGVIFIDDSVVNPFLSVNLKNGIVLSNPVDMRFCNKYQHVDQPFDGQIVITMIGRIEEGKGVDFIIKAFKNTKSDLVRLLIVGDKGDGFHGDYMSHCRELATGDKRILFWGEEKDICKIYAFSDYVIRGEINFRMGRSILEALYSDCHIVIPCSDPKVIAENNELSKFPEKVHYYSPRNMESLSAVFSRLPDRKIVKSNFASNMNEYVYGFNEFIKNTFS